MSSARFERTACCLGGNRSILLSYENRADHYTPLETYLSVESGVEGKGAAFLFIVIRASVQETLKSFYRRVMNEIFHHTTRAVIETVENGWG